jgi:hypothetical protein
VNVELITQAEYARRRGVAKSAVAKAVAERRITLIEGRIDPSVADIQWERNTRARADSGRASSARPSIRAASQSAAMQQPSGDSTSGDAASSPDNRSVGAGAVSQQPAAEPLDAGRGPPPPEPPRAQPSYEPSESGYSYDRARREKYEADLAEIKLREQRGDLVRKVEVRAEMAARIGQLRERLLQLPARLAHALSPEARVLLESELRDVLSQASDATRSAVDDAVRHSVGAGPGLAAAAA